MCIFKKYCNTHGKNAFTLIEMLAVVSVILILMGITFGITKGVSNQQARAQARAELAMIAQALEAFKLIYGDYPVISEGDAATSSRNAEELTLALTGFSYLVPGTGDTTRAMVNVAAGASRDSFIDPQQMNFRRDFGNPTSASELNGNYLIDPWREPYVYVYNRGATDNTWDTMGYVLFSKGPDKTADADTDGNDIEDTGILNESSEHNLDNIYPNQL